VQPQVVPGTPLAVVGTFLQLIAINHDAATQSVDMLLMWHDVYGVAWVCVQGAAVVVGTARIFPPLASVRVFPCSLCSACLLKLHCLFKAALPLFGIALHAPIFTSALPFLSNRF